MGVSVSEGSAEAGQRLRGKQAGGAGEASEKGEGVGASVDAPREAGELLPRKRGARLRPRLRIRKCEGLLGVERGDAPAEAPFARSPEAGREEAVNRLGGGLFGRDRMERVGKHRPRRRIQRLGGGKEGRDGGQGGGRGGGGGASPGGGLGGAAEVSEARIFHPAVEQHLLARPARNFHRRFHRQACSGQEARVVVLAEGLFALLLVELEEPALLAALDESR